MAEEPFVDHYEVLQISPNADGDTVERIFRHLAKRYHPDNAHQGNRTRFEEITKAYHVLRDPERRAAYDVQHQRWGAQRVTLAQEAQDAGGFSEDHQLRARTLSLLYVQRRREPSKPGLGNMELCKLLACPYELLEFHLWYLRQKKWVELMENGMLAITADGVDRVEEDRVLVRRDRLLASRTASADAGESPAPPRRSDPLAGKP